ncbi:MAG: protoheme IX farnesyltransferase [Bacteroidales bacterium]|nr:protoheme IX farnesyltransferase [Bacteroidales bacterium]
MRSRIARIAGVINELTRTRLSAAVTFSGAAGYLLYEGWQSSPSFPVALAGIFLLSSGSSALNQYQERRTDALMSRTAGRPLPAGRITPSRVLSIALLLLLSGAIMLSLIPGAMPLLLGLGTVVIYNFLYTPLKKGTYLAVIPGALTGAIPPLIGFTAAGGSLAEPPALFLAGFMFTWQLPHFWLLISAYRSQYLNAGFSSLAGKPDDKTIRVVIPLWIMMVSAALLFAGRFGIDIGRGLWFILAAVNILVIALFLNLLVRNDQPSTNRSAFIALNGFGAAVLTILIISTL